jgi:ABC-type glycerol-3-phosphate transport system substrate-binding protein
MKKLLIPAALAAVGTALMGASAQGPTTVKIWAQLVSQAPSVQKELDLFMKANPDIKVEYTAIVSKEYHQQIALAFKSNNSPDIFSTAVGEGGDAWKIAATENNWALPLDKHITPAFRAQFPNGSFEDGVNMFDGKTYSLPWNGASEGGFFMFVNVKAFKDAGLVDAKGNVKVPKTWAEQRAAAKQIVAKSGGKIYGVGFGAKQGDYAIIGPASGVALSGVTTESYGRYIDWRTGKYAFNNTPWRSWLNHWIDMKEDGTIYPQSSAIDDEQARVLFGEGRYAMYYNGVWSPGSWAKTNPDFKEKDYIVAMPPTMTGKLKSWVHGGKANSAFAISSQTKNEDAAWKVFNFLHSKESASRWAGYGEGLRVFPESADAMTGSAAQMARLGQQKLKQSPSFNVIRPQLVDVKENAVVKNHAYWILAAFNGQLKKPDVTKTLIQVENDFNAELDKGVAAAQKAGSKVTRRDFAFAQWKPFEDQSTEDLKALLK